MDLGHHKDRAQRRSWTPDAQPPLRAVDIPTGQVGTPEELASMVALPAPERASDVTGIAIQLDGSLILRRV